MPCSWDWHHELWDLNQREVLSLSSGISHKKKEERNSRVGQRVALHEVKNFAMLGVLCQQFNYFFLKHYGCLVFCLLTSKIHKPMMTCIS